MDENSSLHYKYQLFFKMTWWVKVIKIQQAKNCVLKWKNCGKQNEKFDATENENNVKSKMIIANIVIIMCVS